jgi:hypothetical protein
MIDLMLCTGQIGYPIPIPRAEPHIKRFLKICTMIELQSVQ